MSSADTVGTLLAAIANIINDGIRILSHVDKRHWGPDEQEQLDALEITLDEAKRDFQELAPLVNGYLYYENDRTRKTLDELRNLCRHFDAHNQNFQYWARTGGPINPIWARDTFDLRRDLHRAQCRAAQRIYAVSRESSPRCLGAFLVFRKQRESVAASTASSTVASPTGSTTRFSQEHDRGRPRRHNNYASGRYPQSPPLAPSSQESLVDESSGYFAQQRTRRLRQQEDELKACSSIGRFERHGDDDIAFVCDYCDGSIVWEDLETMPTTRTIDDIEAESDLLPKDPHPFDRYIMSSPSPPPLPPLPLILPVQNAMPLSPPPHASSFPTPMSPPRPSPRRTSSIFSQGSGRSYKTSSSSATTIASTATAIATITPAWQATGFTRTTNPSCKGVEKRIVYAPLAIANHMAPRSGQWESRILCPLCGPGNNNRATVTKHNSSSRSSRNNHNSHHHNSIDGRISNDSGAIINDDFYRHYRSHNSSNINKNTTNNDDNNTNDLNDNYNDEIRFWGDAEEQGFEDLEALVEHLEWQHGPAASGLALPTLPVRVPILSDAASSCVVM